MNNNDWNNNSKNDDEFVVPDHIQKAFDDVVSMPDSGQNTDQNQDNIVSFDDHHAPEPPQNNQFQSFVNDPPAPPQEPPIPSSPPENQEPFNPMDLAPSVEPPKPDPVREAPPAEEVTSNEPANENQQLKTPEPSTFDTPPVIKNPEPSSLGSSATSSLSSEDVKLPKKKLLRPTKKLTAVIVMGLIGVGMLVYGIRQAQLLSQVNKPVVNNNDVAGIVEKVKKLVDLPTNEAPSQIANVTDTKKLSASSFFAHAANGDIVLVYQKSKVAVLYRPSTNKVVAIGPIGASRNQSVAGASTQATPTVSPTPAQITPTPTVIPVRNSVPTSTPRTASPTSIPSPAPSQ